MDSSIADSGAIVKEVNNGGRNVRSDPRHEEQVQKEFLFIDLTLLQSKG